MPDRTWMDDGACGYPGNDRDWWTASGFTTEGRKAIEICGLCPVRHPCLTEAMRREGNASAHQRGGIWGGLTPKERRTLYDHQRQAAA